MARNEVQSEGTSRLSIDNRARRARYYRATNGKCFYCGEPVTNKGCSDGRDWLLKPRSQMVREHKMPTIRGGEDDPANYVTACAGCNGSKGSFAFDEYRFLRGLQQNSLNFRFALEAPIASPRDWLCCHSDRHERQLLIHNVPATAEAYRLRNGWARGPRARA